MKVLMLNGSPHKDGVIALALHTVADVLKEEGIESEILDVGGQVIPGCLGCGYCHHNAGCVRHDIVDEVSRKFEEADGLVVGSPIYYASANGTLIALLDRLFYSSRFDKTMKVGASVVSCRRGGASATFDELNKYFTISGMPIVSSQYWNSIHGNSKEEALKDLEGLQTMRTLGRNMAFLLQAIHEKKERDGLPAKERGTFTNFIR